MAELALDLADIADRAKMDDDRPGYLRASRQLQQVLEDLEPKTRGKHDRADRAEDDRADELAGVMGAGPTMGNAADA